MPVAYGLALVKNDGSHWGLTPVAFLLFLMLLNQWIWPIIRERHMTEYEGEQMKDTEKAIIREIDGRTAYAKAHYSQYSVDGTDIEQYIRDTLVLAKEEGYYIGIFDSYIVLALHFIMTGKENKGISMIGEAEEMSRIHDFPQIKRLDVYRTYTVYYMEVEGNLRKGLEYNRKALIIAEALGDKHIIARIQANMGVINVQMGQYDLASRLLEDAVEYSESFDDRFHLKYDYSNLAECYYHLGRKSEAETYYLKAMEIAREYNELAVFQNTASGLGVIYSEEGRTDEALELLAETIDRARESKSTRFLLETVMALAKIHYESGQLIIAVETLIENEKVLEEVPHYQLTQRYYEMLSEYSEEIGELRTALDAARKYHEAFVQSSEHENQRTLNEVLHQEYEKAVNRLESIAALGRELTLMTDMNQLIQEIRLTLEGLMSVDVIGLGALDGEDINFDFFFTDGHQAPPMKARVSEANTLAAWVISNRKDLFINDYEREQHKYLKKTEKRVSSNNPTPSQSVMYEPLFIKDEIIGVFTIQSYNKIAYNTEDMEIFRIIGTYVAIAMKNIQQAEELERLSRTDSLTGLLNRRAFSEGYENRMRETDQAIAMLIMDVDHFKKINDDFGHPTGDEVLVSLSDLLRDSQVDRELICRMGGEEFAVVMVGETYDEVASQAEQLRERISTTELSDKNPQLKITVSIGVAYTSRSDNSNDYVTMYHEADEQLYRAKALGRNRTCSVEI